MNDPVERRLKQIPKSMVRQYRVAISGTSRKAAIFAFCQECTGYERAAIRDCKDSGCPLWPYRPYQRSDDKEAKDEE